MSSDGYGEGGYGGGLYGDPALDEETLETTERSFQHPLVTPLTDTTTRALLLASIQGHELLDISIGEVADAQHLPTAEGAHIDRLGLLVGAKRDGLEQDKHFRARVRAEGGLIRLRPTYEGLDQYAGTLLEANDSKYRLDRPKGGVAEIVATSSTWDGATLDRNEITDYATELVPEGHRVEKVEASP